MESIPKNSSRSGARRRNKANRVDVGKQHFIDSNTSGGTAVRVRVADDISRPSVVASITRMKMPVKLQTQVHWFSTSFQLVSALTSNAITEFNTPFALNQASNAFATGIQALFDQYAIFAVYVRSSIYASSTTSNLSQEYTTAIDFDNVATLSSTSNLRAFSTACTTSTSEVQERYIEPCNAPALYSGSVFTHFGQDRLWVDSVNSGTPHYGYRLICNNVGASSVGNITLDVTMIVCARNTI